MTGSRRGQVGVSIQTSCVSTHRVLEPVRKDAGDWLDPPLEPLRHLDPRKSILSQPACSTWGWTTSPGIAPPTTLFILSHRSLREKMSYSWISWPCFLSRGFFCSRVDTQPPRTGSSCEAVVWVLGAKPGSPRRTSTLNRPAISPAPSPL